MSVKFETNSFSRIKVLLTLRGLRQIDAARKLGISSASFSDKLKGDIRFSADEIAKLADLFGVSTDVLLGREPLEVV
ncbi:helix-turn-helix domain-containing protein [Bifidobacterium phasiani]|uniref:Helix-turn-helix transcriptional regulator n=1 Tax=Bifidobacterium phasiani TaxID=2834431 RepID=A0ABS6WBV0_9BIFI|nr:helix-turn-helix transcriptional regulator [Bifidobacterium phasiani]MBW3083221.1 helix-turn-helix transcriptional regulator [Bifidobacterium phasiani]